MTADSWGDGGDVHSEQKVAVGPAVHCRPPVRLTKKVPIQSSESQTLSSPQEHPIVGPAHENLPLNAYRGAWGFKMKEIHWKQFEVTGC